MAQKIAILPENLANQIAAGEVVERPASVVKELIENALDASATEIFIDVDKGGRSLVRVADNGCGMNRDDAFLCLERHATSKIRSEHDLFALHTMGFRGEALPAIASVSRLRLITRSADQEAGWLIYAEGGTIRQADAAGTPVGTVIEVRDLFFNTPGRRKFLRKDETEFGHVADVVTRIALARPEVQLRLNRDGRTYLETYRHRTLEERVGALLGSSLTRDLLPVEIDSGDGLLLFGLIGPPGASRSSTSQLFTYVNGRYVKDRIFQHAVMEAYRSLLEKKRYPVAVLFLDLPPGQVDVNVHPTKHEVRFREQKQVHDFIAAALRQVLGKVNPVAASFRENWSPEKSSPGGNWPTGSPPGVPEKAGRLTGDPDGRFELPTVSVSQSVKKEAFPLGEVSSDTRALPNGWRLIGQYLNSYLICQADEELVIIDQHAAHERIGFEQMKSELHHGKLESQSLLFPEIIELNNQEAATLDAVLEDLGRFGFDVQPFGPRTFTIKAIPRILANTDIRRLMMDVAAELNDVGGSVGIDSAIEKVLKLLACHGMVRAGQALSHSESLQLLSDLGRIGFAACCPHGRPVVKRLSRAAVEKFFHRA